MVCVGDDDDDDVEGQTKTQRADRLRSYNHFTTGQIVNAPDDEPENASAWSQFAPISTVRQLQQNSDEFKQFTTKPTGDAVDHETFN